MTERSTAALALATVLAATVPATESVRAAEKPITVVAFGDSLTSGHRLPKDDAYPARLEEKLDDGGFDAKVFNHGRSGDTSAGALNRLRAALRENPDILIVAFGANDGLRGVPVSQVRENLSKIIERAQLQGAAVLLVGMEALPLYGMQYSVDFHNMFPALAAEYKVPLVPFMLDGVIGNRALMTSDGIHPNAEGTKVMAATIWKALEPMVNTITSVR